MHSIDLLLYPSVCQFCYSPVLNSNTGFVCKRCQKKTQRVSAPWCLKCGIPCNDDHQLTSDCNYCSKMKFSRARSLFIAEGIPREIVHQLKYNQHEYFEPLIKIWLRDILKLDLYKLPKAIIPVPLYPVKQRERGINQSETIAHIASNYIKAPVNTKILRRTRDTQSQTTLTKGMRKKNVKDAFSCSEKINNGQFLIVDDVMTTGATANECAKTLIQNGASAVEIFTLTRGMPLDYACS